MNATNEAARLAVVRRYAILDTPPDGAFDNITSLAAHFFDVPIAVVSIVDHDRVWFKSRQGLGVEQVGVDPGLCTSAILKDVPTIIPDTRLDPQSLANPLVAGEFGLRFYAAAPLTTASGHKLGTLAVMDKQPRDVSESQAKVLQDLAAVVVDQLELRLVAREMVRLKEELYERTLEQKAQAEQRFQQAFDNAPIGMAMLSSDLLLVEVNAAFCSLFGHREADLLLKPIADLMHPDHVEACMLNFSTLASGEARTHKTEMRCLTASERVVTVRVTLGSIVEGSDKHPTRFIAQVEDISQHRGEVPQHKMANL